MPAARPKPSHFEVVRPRPIIISVAQNKGGTAKTTTTLNLGAALAARGKRVLLIDMDPQGNLTSGTGIDLASLTSSM